MFQDNEVQVNEVKQENPTEKSHLSLNIQVNVPSYDSMGFKEHTTVPLYQTDIGKHQNFFKAIKEESKEKEFEFLDSFMREMDRINDPEKLAYGIMFSALTDGANFELPKRETPVIFFEVSKEEREIEPFFPGAKLSTTVKNLLLLQITERLKASFLLKRNLWPEQKATLLILLSRAIQELTIEWKNDQVTPFIEKTQKNKQEVVFVYDEDEKKKEILSKIFSDSLRKKLDETIEKFCKNYLQQENIICYLPEGVKNATTAAQVAESVIIALLNGMQLLTLKENEISIVGLYAEKKFDKTIHEDLNQILIKEITRSMLLGKNLENEQRYQLIFLVTQSIQKQMVKEEITHDTNILKFSFNKEQIITAIKKGITLFKENYLTESNKVSSKVRTTEEEEQTIRCNPFGCSLM